MAVSETTEYHILPVADHVLPAGMDFVFVECQGELWLALRGASLTAPILEDAWDAYRHMQEAG